MLFMAPLQITMSKMLYLQRFQRQQQPLTPQAETDPLIAPYREGSITSQDAYGAVSMSASTTMDGSHVAGGATGTLSTSAKERIDKIGREVGG